MRGLDFADPLENAADPIGGKEEKLPKTDSVHLRPDTGIPEQRLDFGSEDERFSRDGIKQRLDAEAVAREIGFVQRRVIYRKGKDAVEHGSAFFPEKDIEIQDDLRIAVGFGRDAVFFDKSGKLRRIVQLSVVNMVKSCPM